MEEKVTERDLALDKLMMDSEEELDKEYDDFKKYIEEEQDNYAEWMLYLMERALWRGIVRIVREWLPQKMVYVLYVKSSFAQGL